MKSPMSDYVCVPMTSYPCSFILVGIPDTSSVAFRDVNMVEETPLSVTSAYKKNCVHFSKYLAQSRYSCIVIVYRLTSDFLFFDGDPTRCCLISLKILLNLSIVLYNALTSSLISFNSRDCSPY